LGNARQVKVLPGRKTDVGDAAWLCELLECGLLRGSFVPPAAIRELGDLTRYGKRLIPPHPAEGQRIHKTLEDAGIRLGSVAADVLGVSGRALLAALLAGERDPRSSPNWRGAGCGTSFPSCARRCGVASATTTPCWCGWPWSMSSGWSGPSPSSTPRSTGSSPRSPRPVTASTPAPGSASGPPRHPGRDRVDMSVFPTAGHLAAWAGRCPGNNLTGGKRRSGKPTRATAGWGRC
jgi:transposase